VTPRDLQNMLDRIEELSKRGDMAEAQRLMEQLNQMLNNLQMARPGQQDPRQREMNQALLSNQGTENPFRIWRELGATMTQHATIVRYNKGLDEADAKLVELLERYKNVNLSDKTQWANTSFAFTRQLFNMLQLARVIVQGARLRDESRGAHYKPEFEARDDEKFLKTTMATFENGAPSISYQDVDIQYIKPRPRVYTSS